MLGRIKYQWKRLRKSNYIVLVGILSLFLIVAGFSYAIFAVKSESKGTLNIVTGDLVINVESEQLDSKNRITVGARESKEITVTLKNENGRDVKFNFWYKGVNEVEVTYDGEGDIPPTEEGEIIKRNEQRTYKLIITNNSSSNHIVRFGSNGGFYDRELVFPKGKRIIEKKNENITIVKDNNMIAVVYNEIESTWEKADNNNWYNYKIGKWANAVTVTSATRDKYQGALSGTAISMSDIETMWVWIPRYSYTIGSEDGTAYYGKQGEYLNSVPTQALPGEIDIKFIGKEEKEVGSAQYRVQEGISGWRTPDAFTFGDEELSGIWVGKFETSSSTPSAANGGGNVTTLDAMIKPNVVSWRGLQVANIAEIGRNVTRSGNRYGFSSNNLNSHAMKNDEWAIVAYLSQSRYGKLGNKNYTSAAKEVYHNNSTNWMTGCSSGKFNAVRYEGCQYTYDVNISGTGASTTGTIYGIYDMNGGTWEYVMGDYTSNGQRYTGNSLGSNLHSGYSGLFKDGSIYTGKAWLEDKYYNFYTSNNVLNSCDGKICKSHALSETLGWYSDLAVMITNEYPWIARGASSADGVNSGVFSFYRLYGHSGPGYSFRLVLSAS